VSAKAEREPAASTAGAAPARATPAPSPSALLLRLQQGAGNAAVASLARRRLASRRIQRYDLQTEFRREGKLRPLTARSLVGILEQVSDEYLAEIAAARDRNPLLSDFGAARTTFDRAEKEGNQSPPPMPASIGSTQLSISKGMYTNLASKDDANAIFGVEHAVRGGGPSYPELVAALLRYREGNHLTDREVAGQMLAALRGELDGAVGHPTNRAVVALPTAVLAGAETMRNSKAYGSLLMFLELLATGAAGLTLEDGLGVGVVRKDKTENQGLDATLAFFRIPVTPNAPKARRKKALEDYVAKLDLDEATKKKILKLDVNPAVWGGMIPMTGSDTQRMGGASVEEGVPLNLVQAKEGSLAITWLKEVWLPNALKENKKILSQLRSNDIRKLFHDLLRRYDRSPSTASSLQNVDLTGSGAGRDDDFESDSKQSRPPRSDYDMQGALAASTVGAYVLTDFQRKWLSQQRLREVEVTPDGDCLFRAFVESADDPRAESVRDVRGKLALKLQAEPRFEHIRALDTFRRDFLENLTKSSTFDFAGLAGDMMPQIIATAFGVKLSIVGSATVTPVGDGSPEITLIRFDTGALHYHGTKPVG
jgi:hypothetical protein